LWNEKQVTFQGTVILDGCAMLWTILWPASAAKVSDFIKAAVTSTMERMESTTTVVVVLDRH